MHIFSHTELLVKFASPDDINIQNDVINRVSNYCGKPVTNYTLDEYPVDLKRTFYHSFWFTFILCSTLGGSIKVLVLQNKFIYLFQVMGVVHPTI